MDSMKQAAECSQYRQRQDQTVARLKRALTNHDRTQNKTAQQLAIALAEAELQRERRKAEAAIGFAA